MLRIKCLFWNINRKATPFENIIRDISKGIDILILAEAFNINETTVTTLTGLRCIKSLTPTDHKNITPKVFSSNIGFSISHLNTVVSKRLVLNVLKPDGHDEILLGGIHFPSKLDYGTETQEDIANSYIRWINEVEDLFSIKKTVLAGDFNMNPFELGMIKPKTFNATLSKKIAQSNITRTFHFEEYHYFYNPMWSFMGDHNYGTNTLKIPGSYYFPTTTDVEAVYWNVFDKVIVRPEVINNLDLSSISFPNNLGGHQFLDANFQIDSTNYSDHLPLLFDLIF